MNQINRLLCCFLAAFSLVGTPASAAENLEHAPDITGTWTKSQALPDGRTLSVEVGFSRDNTFSGTASLDRNPIWTYAGKWNIEGRALNYHYEQSSRPLGTEDKVDIDDIVSVSTNSLVLRSRKTGAEHIFLRVN